jgi:drug/metabolite transporter (DMT)-like permease
MQLLCGGAALGIVGLASGEFGRVHPAAFSRSSLLALLYLIFFGAIIAFSAYSWLVQNAPPAIVSTYAYVNPAIAVLLGWAFLDEAVPSTTLIAGAVIVVAVAMIVGSRTKMREGEPAAGAPAIDEPLAAEA